MAVDLLQSRRNYNEKCTWWSRDERDEYGSDELIMRRIPSGHFMAKEEAPTNIRENILNGTFSVTRTTITIKTPDSVEGIKQNDLVLFRDEKWMVVSVQKRLAKVKQSQLLNYKNCSNYWYIELRK